MSGDTDGFLQSVGQMWAEDIIVGKGITVDLVSQTSVVPEMVCRKGDIGVSREENWLSVVLSFHLGKFFESSVDFLADSP